MHFSQLYAQAYVFSENLSCVLDSRAYTVIVYILKKTQLLLRLSSEKKWSQFESFSEMFDYAINCFQYCAIHIAINIRRESIFKQIYFQSYINLSYSIVFNYIKSFYCLHNRR